MECTDSDATQKSSDPYEEDQDDMCEIGDNDLRPEWPDGGMVCPIVGCGTTFYVNLTTYWGHWKRKHHGQLEQLHCPKCPHKSLNKKCFATHLNKKHKVKKSDLDKIIASVHKEFVPNKEFIPPGTQRCPKRKSLETQRGAKRKRIKSPSQESKCKQDGNNLSLTNAEASGGLQKKATKPAENKVMQKMFACTVCDFKSIQKSSVFMHVRNEHGMPTYVATGRITTTVMETNSQYLDAEKLYSPELLREESKSIVMVKPDDSEASGGLQKKATKPAENKVMQKMFACTVCDFKSIQKSSVFMHVRNEHGIPTYVATGRITTTIMETNSQYLDAEKLYSPELLREESKSIVMVKPDDSETDVNVSICNVAKDVSSADEIKRLSSTPASETGQKDSNEGSNKNVSHGNGASRKASILHPDQSKNVTVCPPTEAQNISVSNAENEKEISNSSFIIQMEEKSEAAQLPDEGWHVGGMRCHVPSCGSQHFDTLNSYQAHWKKVHSDTIKKFNCPLCSFKQSEKLQLQRHLRLKHNVDKTAVQGILSIVKAEVLPNLQYIDPGTVQHPKGKQHDISGSEGKTKMPRLSAAQESEMKQTTGGQKHSTEQTDSGDPAVGGTSRSTQGIQSDNRQYTDDFSSQDKNILQVGLKVDTVAKLSNEDDVSNDTILQDVAQLEREETETKVCVTKVQANAVEIKRKFADFDKGTIQRKKAVDTQVSDCVDEDGDDDESDYHESDPDLTVTDDSELDEVREAEDLDTVVRPIFLDGQMLCPGSGCLDHVYNSLKAFYEHWQTKHQVSVQRFECPSCSFKDIRKMEIRRHLKQDHNVRHRSLLEELLSLVKLEFKPKTGEESKPETSGKRKSTSQEKAKNKKQKLSIGSDSDEKEDAKSGKDKKSKGNIRPACVKGMCCPVKACSSEKFDTYYRLEEHWKSKHEKYIKIYTCLKCSFKDARENNFWHHLRNGHHLAAECTDRIIEKAKKNRKRILNTKFIDPGQYECPSRSAERKVSSSKEREGIYSMPEWVESGMPCPVRECGDHHYTSHASFISHWKKKHTNRCMKFGCPKCSIRYFDKTDLKCHLRHRHHYQGKRLEEMMPKIKSIIVDNRGFSDTRAQKGPEIKDVLLKEKSSKREKSKDKDKTKKGNNAGNIVSDEYLKDDVIKEETEVEQQHSAEDDHTLVWVEGGMPCPVEACGGHIYSKDYKLSRHWILTHHPYKTLLFCPQCSYRQNTRSKMRRHIRDMHGITGPELYSKMGNLNNLKMMNTRFIDPGNRRCPKRWKGQSTEEYEAVENPNNNSQRSNSLVTVTLKGDVSAIVRSDGSQKAGTDTVQKINEAEYTGTWADRESEEILSKALIPIKWVSGMSCPVMNCGASHFMSMLSFCSHWDNIHQLHILKFKCPMCTFTNITKANIMAHLSAQHKMSDAKVNQIKNVKVKNNRYIDPGFYYFSEIEEMKQFRADMTTTSPLEKKENDSRSVDQLHQEVNNACGKNQTSREFLEAEEKFDDKTSTSILTKDASLEGRHEARKVTVTQQSGKSGTNETLEGPNKTKDKEPSEETNTEGETLIRVKWVQGMKCPVENCLTGNTNFFTLTSFHHHWEIRHYPCVREFKCPRCGFQNLQRDRVGKHIQMLHGMVLHIQSVSVTNVNYIDPGQYYCPPLELFKAEAGPKEASGGLQKKATQAAEKKLRYPNKLTFVPGMPCPVENCSTLCFASLPAFEHHWNERHAKMLKIYACIVCNFKSLKRPIVFMHVRNEHGIPKCFARGRITTVRKTNSQYLDAEKLHFPEFLRESIVMVKPDELEMDLATDQKGEIEKDRKISWMAGMSCPVRTCGSETYLTLDSFYSHWKSTHHMELQMLQCSQCTFKASQNSEIENHLKSHHWILAEKDIKEALTKVKAVKVFNPSFKDSEGYHFELRKTEEEGENMPSKSENKPLKQVSNEMDLATDQKGEIEKDRKISWMAGMSCPVRTCGSETYLTLDSFCSHWKSTHHMELQMLQCSQCTFKASQNSEIENHLKSHHWILAEKDIKEALTKVKAVKVFNPSFKDSEGYHFELRKTEEEGENMPSKSENKPLKQVSNDTKDEGQLGKDTIKVEIKFSGESKHKLSPKKEKVVWFFGMSCPVTNCGARNFVSLRAFHNHWENVHHPYIKKFECPVCQYNNTQREMIVNHLRLLHNTIKTNDVRDLSQIKLVDVGNPMYKDPGRFYFGNVPSMPSKIPDVETMANTSPEQDKEIKIENNDRDNPNASKAEICAKPEASKNNFQDMDRQEDIVLGEEDQGHLGMRIEKTSNQGVRKDKTLKLIPQQDQSQAKCKENMEKSDYEEKGMGLDGHKESIYKTKDKSLGENQASVSENVDNTCDTNGEKIKEAIKMVEELKKSDENIGKIDEQKELISTLHATEKHRKIDTIGKRQVNQSAEKSKNKQQKVEEHVKQREANGKNVDPTVQERKDMKLEKSEKDESEAQKHQGTYSGLKEQKKPLESTQEADVNRENILTKDTTQRVDKISDKDEKSRMPAPKNQEKKVTTADTSDASVESTKKSSLENVDLGLKSLSSESAVGKKEPIKVVFVSNMSCPVDKCGTFHFTSLSAFEDHWMKRHLPVREHFKCRICNFRNIVRKSTYRHVKKVHGIMYPMLHENIYIVTDTNSQFLDPGPLHFEKCLSELAEVAKSTNGTKSASAMQKKEEKVTTADTSEASVESTKKSSSENVDLGLKSLSSESAAGKKEPIKVVFVSNMSCPVDKCGTLHFTSLSAFEDHWMKRHLPVREHFKCSICNFRNIVRKSTYRHVKKVHGIMYPMLHENIYIVTDTNSQFLDPGPLHFEKCLSELAEVARSTSGTKSALAMQKKEEKESKSTSQKEWGKIVVEWKYNMTCPVNKCDSKIYTSWTTYCQHWKIVHEQQFLKAPACPKCSFQSRQRSYLIRHMKRCHKLMGMELERAEEEIKFVDVENPSFIDPGNHTCNWFGKSSKSEKSYAGASSENDVRKDSQAGGDTEMIDVLSSDEEGVVYWKENGMVCPVPKCSRDVFLRLDLMQYHWKEKHTFYWEFFYCRLCGKRSPERKQLIKHLFLDHSFPYRKAKEVSRMARLQKAKNPKYIDPGRLVCPQFRLRDSQQEKSSTDKIKGEKEAKRSDDAKETISVSQAVTDTDADVLRFSISFGVKSDEKEQEKMFGKSQGPGKGVQRKVDRTNKDNSTTDKKENKEDVSKKTKENMHQSKNSIKKDSLSEVSRQERNDSEIWWNEKGMACPVKVCGPHIYPSLQSLEDHWKIHHIHITVWLKCPLCNWSVTSHSVECQMKNLRSHIISNHKISLYETGVILDTFKPCWRTNKTYIDPGGMSCPKPISCLKTLLSSDPIKTSQPSTSSAKNIIYSIDNSSEREGSQTMKISQQLNLVVKQEIESESNGQPEITHTFQGPSKEIQAEVDRIAQENKTSNSKGKEIFGKDDSLRKGQKDLNNKSNGGFNKSNEATSEVTRPESKDTNEIWWNEGGTVCPVKACIRLGFFFKFENLEKHWRFVHSPMVSVFTCHRCGWTETEPKYFCQHLKKRHTISPHEREDILRKTTPSESVNRFYIDPGKMSCPKIKSSTELVGISQQSTSSSKDIRHKSEDSHNKDGKQSRGASQKSSTVVKEKVEWKDGGITCPVRQKRNECSDICCNEKGMTCPVKICGPHIYFRLENLQRHWKNRHIHMIERLQCTLCNWSVAYQPATDQMKNLRQHIISNHRISQYEAGDILDTIKPCWGMNKIYIDPGGMSCPKTISFLKTPLSSNPVKTSHPITSSAKNVGHSINNISKREDSQTRKISQHSNLVVKPEIASDSKGQPEILQTFQGSSKEIQTEVGRTTKENKTTHSEENEISDKVNSLKEDQKVLNRKSNEGFEGNVHQSKSEINNKATSEVTRLQSKDTNKIWWNEGGMVCPVKACNKLHFYSKLEDLEKHWRLVHSSIGSVFACHRCGWTETEPRYLREHLKKRHKISPRGIEDIFLRTTPSESVNRFYIDPGNTSCPKIKSGTELVGISQRSTSSSKDTGHISEDSHNKDGKQSREASKKSSTVVKEVRWKKGGIACPVRGCIRKSYIIHSLGDFQQHWANLHQDFLMTYKCPMCKINKTNRIEVQIHLVKKHHLHVSAAKKAANMVKQVQGINKFYRNPGNYVLKSTSLSSQNEKSGSSIPSKSHTVEKDAKASSKISAVEAKSGSVSKGTKPTQSGPKPTGTPKSGVEISCTATVQRKRDGDNRSADNKETSVFGVVLHDSSAEQPTLTVKVEMESKPRVSPKDIKDRLEKQKLFIRGRVESTEEEVKTVISSGYSDDPKISDTRVLTENKTRKGGDRLVTGEMQEKKQLASKMVTAIGETWPKFSDGKCETIPNVGDIDTSSQGEQSVNQGLSPKNMHSLFSWVHQHLESLSEVVTDLKQHAANLPSKQYKELLDQQSIDEVDSCDASNETVQRGRVGKSIVEDQTKTSSKETYVTATSGHFDDLLKKHESGLSDHAAVEKAVSRESLEETYPRDNRSIIVVEDEDLIRSSYKEDSSNEDMSEFICIDEIGDDDAEANEESPEEQSAKETESPGHPEYEIRDEVSSPTEDEQNEDLLQHFVCLDEIGDEEGDE